MVIRKLETWKVERNKHFFDSAREAGSSMPWDVVVLKLTDANGLSMGNYRPGIQNKGANNYTINDLSSIHNGYYYVSVEQDGNIIGRITVLIAH